VIVKPPNPEDRHQCMAAKRFKCLPPVRLKKVLWLDCNVEIRSPTFVEDVFEHVHHGIALYRHSLRDCIYDEARASLDRKYKREPIREQVRSYRKEYPAHGGLYTTPVIAWDRNDPRARELGKAWLEECDRLSFQDQLSFPVVCKRLDIKPGIIPGRMPLEEDGIHADPATLGDEPFDDRLYCHAHL
jgi:hypothetical protein